MKKLAMLALLLACAILIGGCGSKEESQESSKNKDKTQSDGDGLGEKSKINVNAEEGEPANGFLWENNFSEISITGYIGDSNNLVIPDTINGKPVTKIKNEAFYGFAKLETIVIPDSCEKIGYKAFYGCESLKTVKIPNSCNEIAPRAFYDCKSLKTVECSEKVADMLLKQPFTWNDDTYSFYDIFNLEIEKVENNDTICYIYFAS